MSVASRARRAPRPRASPPRWARGRAAHPARAARRRQRAASRDKSCRSRLQEAGAHQGRAAQAERMGGREYADANVVVEYHGSQGIISIVVVELQLRIVCQCVKHVEVWMCPTLGPISTPPDHQDSLGLIKSHQISSVLISAQQGLGLLRGSSVLISAHRCSSGLTSGLLPRV